MIFELFNKIKFDTELSHDNKLFIHLLYDIITHESFGNWIIIQESLLEKWIDLSSIIIQTKDDWNNYQLTALLSWNYTLFMNYSKLEINLDDEKLKKLFWDVYILLLN